MASAVELGRDSGFVWPGLVQCIFNNKNGSPEQTSKQTLKIPEAVAAGRLSRALSEIDDQFVVLFSQSSSQSSVHKIFMMILFIDCPEHFLLCLPRTGAAPPATYLQENIDLRYRRVASPRKGAAPAQCKTLELARARDSRKPDFLVK